MSLSLPEVPRPSSSGKGGRLYSGNCSLLASHGVPVKSAVCREALVLPKLLRSFALFGEQSWTKLEADKGAETSDHGDLSSIAAAEKTELSDEEFSRRELARWATKTRQGVKCRQVPKYRLRLERRMWSVA